mgnify:CR=1 FL=1
MSQVANHLESAGIPTVVIGSARDIVEEHGVARFVFTDFPLGNPCGKPWDVAMQHAIVGIALELFHRAGSRRTTVQAPFAWGDDGWRDRYMAVDDTDALRAAGERRRAAQEARRLR